MANAGINAIDKTIIECVRPRWDKPGMSKSMSGIRPKRKTSGRFSLTPNGFADVLATRYASDRCPTANVFSPLSWFLGEIFRLIFYGFHSSLKCTTHYKTSDHYLVENVATSL